MGDCCRPAKSRDDVEGHRVMAVVRRDDLDERRLTTLLHRHLDGKKTKLFKYQLHVCRVL